jgi:virulence factor Mce-like protein
VEAFADLSTTVETIDTTQLANSFEVLSQTFKDTPEEVRTSLEGLARLSDTISSRDQQLGQLLTATRKVSQVLADRNGEFTQLIVDSNTLLTEVQRRRELIDSILTSTQELSKQLSGLVADNRASLTPALQQLSTVTDILSRNRAALAQTVNNLAPFVRVFANTLGNGRWFDSFVENLLPQSWAACSAAAPPRHRCPWAARGQLMSGSLQRGVAVAATVILLAALGWTILRPAGQYRVTAWFGQTVGLYPGSDVRVLGIPIGTITDVVPQGDRVRVDMLVDDAYDIPAAANAIVLAPSLVSDRYVQFSPVYDGGTKMKDGDTVPLERTATPVELDQVYGALDDLSAALGPNGANKNGALSDLVDVGAANLDGNGEALNRTLTGFSKAVETLSDHRDDLFASLDNLQTFTSALASIDAQVGEFNTNMAAVADQLAQERDDLAAAVRLLNTALSDVAGFVQDNTTLLTTNVNRLADVTLALVQQRQALAEVLDVAPAALGNLSHAYNPDYGTLDTRDNSVGSTSPEVIVCQILAAVGRVTITNLPVQPPAPALPVPLPTTPEGICARLLSGDANATTSRTTSTATACPTSRSC